MDLFHARVVFRKKPKKATWESSYASVGVRGGDEYRRTSTPLQKYCHSEIDGIVFAVDLKHLDLTFEDEYNLREKQVRVTEKLSKGVLTRVWKVAYIHCDWVVTKANWSKLRLTCDLNGYHAIQRTLCIVKWYFTIGIISYVLYLRPESKAWRVPANKMHGRRHWTGSDGSLPKASQNPDPVFYFMPVSSLCETDLYLTSVRTFANNLIEEWSGNRVLACRSSHLCCLQLVCLCRSFYGKFVLSPTPCCFLCPHPEPHHVLSRQTGLTLRGILESWRSRNISTLPEPKHPYQ